MWGHYTIVPIQSQLFGHPNSAPTLPQFISIHPKFPLWDEFGQSWGRVGAQVGKAVHNYDYI
jgi:hypothetical protein